MSAPHLVVFDLDGTLADSQTAIVTTFLQVALHHNLPLPSEQAIAALIGLPLEEMAHHLFPEGVNTSTLVADYRQHYFDVAAAQDRLFPGAEATLDALAAAGIRLAIATSKRQDSAERSTARLGIAARFVQIVGGHPARRGKPHPDMLHLILGQNALPPEAAVMVGDTTFDLEMARAAGVRGVGVAWGVHAPSRLAPLAPVAQDWSDLLDLLG